MLMTSGWPRDHGQRRWPGPGGSGDGLPRVRTAVPGEPVVTVAAWAQLLFLLGLLAVSTPLLGSYMAKVYGGGRAPGDRVFLPVERAIYRLCRVDPEREQ